MSEITEFSASELAALISTRRLSPVEILAAYLDRIDRLNPRLNAIVTLAVDEAKAGAREAEAAVSRGDDLGPLHGLPILIKDVTETAGIRTTYGSPFFRDHVPDEDADVVRRLKAAGAIVLGKTNTPEFATGAHTDNPVFGVTCNPWDTRLSAAGSSGGSAAAVAAGLAPFAHGTDYGGSLRVPAAFCGIIGLRTTAGLIPNQPLRLPWDSGQVHGPLSRTAEDAALFLDATTGLDPLWPMSAAAPWVSARAALRAETRALRVAYVEDIAGLGVDNDVRETCATCVKGLAGCDVQVDDVTLDVSDGIEAYKALRGARTVAQNLPRLDRLDQLGANLAGNIRDGLGLRTVDLAAAQRTRTEVLHRFADLLRRYDLIATPCTPVSGFSVAQPFVDHIAGRKLASYIDWIAPTFLVTLSGFPAASVPAGLTPAGRPGRSADHRRALRRADDPRVGPADRHACRHRPPAFGE